MLHHAGSDLAQTVETMMTALCYQGAEDEPGGGRNPPKRRMGLADEHGTPTQNPEGP